MLVIDRLHELIAALDRRRPQPERPGEHRIASEAAELRERAAARIAQLEHEQS